MSDDVEKLVHIGYGAFNAGERIPSLDHWHADGEYVNDARRPRRPGDP